ncbi:hypothetical protein [Microbacterium sp. NPDC079995]|uniref:hypothetical protein n=1 Tax=unclassified Microbacterium TaxID=2609290 RepID=UPI00344CADED
MSDLSRHLPLSNRERVDESAVTGDWREAMADAVLSAAPLITSPDDEARFLADAGLDGALPLADAAARIRAGRRRRIRSLVDATRALLVLAGDRPIDLPATTSGAVALYAVTRMPFERRAAVSGATLVAEDAGWSLGRGPARSAPARDILTFVLGLSDTVPGTPSRREL